jgi:two-component system, cell cycle response regulator
MTESNSDKPVILIVDDSKVIRMAARKMLGSDYETIEAANGVEGWEHIQNNSAISVVFTDMQMPEMDGMQLLANVRASDDEHIAELPVIIITGHEDNEEAKKKVFDNGATDFVTKPFESIDLISRAKSYAKLNRQVTELEKQVGHDKLTGLFNASSFEEQGRKNYAYAHRHRTQMSVVVLEISNFQQIFLSAGKSIAQQIIRAVCKRLTTTLRTEDVAARTGMARVALMLPLANIKDAHDVVERMLEATRKLVFDTGKEKLRVDLVCGISAVNLHAESDFPTVLKQAESALAEALQGGDQKIVQFVDAQAEPEPVITEEDIFQAFKHILHGDHSQIPTEHLPAVVERLEAFMQYIDSK